MTAPNGTDMGPLAGWVLVLLGARTLIGRPVYSPGLKFSGGLETADRVTGLSPVYNLECGLTKEGPAYRALPLLFLSSVTSVHVSDGACTLEISTLSRLERKTLESAVLQADDLVRQLRAQDSGLVVPGKPSLVLK